MEVTDAQRRSLNAVLRLQLTAVHRQFTHILLLRAWGDGPSAERLKAVDDVDFPTVMRAIDRVVATGDRLDLGGDGASFAAHLPSIGCSRAAVFAAEQAAESHLRSAVEAATAAFAGAPRSAVHALLGDAMSPRLAYARWLDRQLAVHARSPDVPSPPAFGGATAGMDALFAWLIVAIEQALAHAFVLRHRGDDRLADAAWRASGRAMLHATAIVQLFAQRGSAPRPASVNPSARVGPPRIGGETAVIVEFERAAAARCRIADVEALCRRLAASYRQATGTGRSARKKPCRASRLHSGASRRPTASMRLEGTLGDRRGRHPDGGEVRPALTLTTTPTHAVIVGWQSYLILRLGPASMQDGKWRNEPKRALRHLYGRP